MPAPINGPLVQQNIRLREREEIQYLLGNPPGWMMRFGLSTMAVLLALLLALSYFVQYPDVVTAKVVLTTANPPIRILAGSSQRVAALQVADRQAVQKGQTLAVLENTADWRDVLRLEQWLALPATGSGRLPEGLKLGELQHEWSTLCQHWKDFDYFTSDPGGREKIAQLRQQITQLQEMTFNLQNQRQTQQAAFDLAAKDLQRQRILHENNIISDLEFEKTEAAFLQQKRQLENAAAALIQNRMEIRRTESQITDLGKSSRDSRNDKDLTIAEDLQRLRSAVAAWKQQFLVEAPVAGMVSLTKVWSAQQPIAAGEEVLAVVPLDGSEGATRVIGKATTPVANSGMISSGMQAIIRLDGFPARQFGAIEATVTNISLLPQKEEYLLDLALPPSLTTTYHKPIPFRQEMTGSVRIVTENKRILERIFNHLQDLVQNK